MRDTSLYSINDIRKYVDAENFGLILDTANAKYNAAIWRKYADWGTPTNDREWLQGEKETPILVRASVLGLHSNKPQRNTEGWKVYGGTLPKIGHGFSIDESDLIELRKRSKLNDIPYGNLVTDSLIQNSGNMLGGIHAELNYMLLQAMSTGQINDVAVDGASYDFKFPIKDNRFAKFAEGKAWFGTDGQANADADPIQDLLDAQDYYTEDLNLAVDHWKVSKKLLKKFTQHPSVKKSILATMDYHSENIPNVILTQEKILTAVHDLGIWMFDVIDHKSRHEEDGVAVNDAPAFDEHNFVAAPSTFKPFEMKCMNSIYKDRVNMGGMTAANLYSFVEDRIAVLSTWQERPIENIIDCELYAGPVFKNLSEIGIFTVWAEA